jgi:hypothetical protein
MPCRLALLALASLLAACDRAPTEAPPSIEPTSRPTAEPGPRRLVAVGDLHGDLDATKRALRLAGAIDANDHWSGGDLVVVQTGDCLDRGDHEREILDLLERLAAEARAAGGALHALLGNHELMNVAGDLRYVTRAGFAAFESHAESPPDDLPPAFARMPPFARGRAIAFRPGGVIARELAEQKVAIVIGDSAFVHGGLLPAHARRGIGPINEAVSRFLRGDAPAPTDLLTGEDSPVWTRRFSADPGPDDCALARESLALLGATRMVVGHTVQENGVTAYCDGAVWAIDVGLAAHYGGPTEVLEIANGRARPLRAGARAMPPDEVRAADDVAR